MAAGGQHSGSTPDDLWRGPVVVPQEQRLAVCKQNTIRPRTHQLMLGTQSWRSPEEGSITLSACEVKQVGDTCCHTSAHTGAMCDSDQAISGQLTGKGAAAQAFSQQACPPASAPLQVAGSRAAESKLRRMPVLKETGTDLGTASGACPSCWPPGRRASQRWPGLGRRPQRHCPAARPQQLCSSCLAWPGRHGALESGQNAVSHGQLQAQKVAGGQTCSLFRRTEVQLVACHEGQAPHLLPSKLLDELKLRGVGVLQSRSVLSRPQSRHGQRWTVMPSCRLPR